MLRHLFPGLRKRVAQVLNFKFSRFRPDKILMDRVELTKENRILPLVSLRFLLAIWIFLHHLYPSFWMPLNHRIGSFGTGFFVTGFLAVPYFFILSGFVLAFAYGCDEEDSDDADDSEE